MQLRGDRYIWGKNNKRKTIKKKKNRVKNTQKKRLEPDRRAKKSRVDYGGRERKEFPKRVSLNKNKKRPRGSWLGEIVT